MSAPADAARLDSPTLGGQLPLRVLVLDPEGDHLARVRAALADSPESDRFVLSHAVTVADALARTVDADVVLVPVVGESGLVPLVKLRAEAAAVPVVALAAVERESLAVKAVQLGAADYLLVDRLYGTVLTRALRHAVESERVTAALAHRHAEWPPSLGGGVGGPAAPLRAAFPERFAALVKEYGEILDLAVAQALERRAAAPLEPRLQRLALSAAELRAGPRDIVDLHAAAMKQREPTQGPKRAQLYLAEGRLRLLELMGRLVTIYRDHWLAASRAGH